MLVPTTRAKSIVGICRMTFYISVEKLEALRTTTNNLWLSGELVWGSDDGPGDLGFNGRDNFPSERDSLPLRLRI